MSQSGEGFAPRGFSNVHTGHCFSTGGGDKRELFALSPRCTLHASGLNPTVVPITTFWNKTDG